MWRVLLLSVASLIVLPACNPRSTGLVIANGDDVGILHPQFATTSAEGRVMVALHAGLTRLNPKTLAPEPSLASEFHQLQGGKVWEFVIRENLHWSDGHSLQPDDFVRSWRQLTDPNFGAPYAEWLRGAVFHLRESNILHIEFQHPLPQFGEMCSYQALAPVPQHASPQKVGSGPFRLVSRKIRDRIRVEKNPWFWNAADVDIPQIDFLTVESQFTALNLFLTEDIDYCPAVPTLAIPQLLEKFPDEFQPNPQFATYFLRFNTKNAPFDQIENRRAFASALDSAAISQSVGGGRQPAVGFVPPGVPGWKYATAPDWMKQRRGSKSTGTGEQYRTESEIAPTYGVVEYLYNSSELNRDVAEVLQQQWDRHLHAEVRIANQEWKTFLANQKALEYQISRSSWVGDYFDPMTFLEIFHSESGNNRTGWKNHEFDSLLEQARQN
jgi:oligopeptide transport system substrate-binding protein